MSSKPVRKRAQSEARPSLTRRAAVLVRGRPAFLLVSIAILIPCWWQSRVQAGDLGSHIYNAWLSQLVAAGRAPGIVVAWQSTNVLFDLMLSGLLGVAGADAAQKVTVSAAVLVFVWGAFAFVSAVAKKAAWRILPVVAMLAYGWVFRMGFFNFYLSLGLSFGVMALAWRGGRARLAAALPLAALAWVAHALPVVWAVGVLLYRWLAGRVVERYRIYVFAGACVVVIVLRLAVSALAATRWFPWQVRLLTGLDQVWVYDGKYQAVAAGLLLMWALAFAALLRSPGAAALVSQVPFQVCAMMAFGIVVFPTEVLLPGYTHSLAFIAERMSLALAVCVCAVIARAEVKRYHAYAVWAIALVYFGFLYRDELILNSVEDEMTSLVLKLPPGQRVVEGVNDPDLRVNVLAHMVDRVCVGRCYSYGNYEPATRQFRLRVEGSSPLVVSTYKDAWRIETGSYEVKRSDLPLYQVVYTPVTRLFIRALPAGQACGISHWNPL